MLMVSFVLWLYNCLLLVFLPAPPKGLGLVYKSQFAAPLHSHV